MNSQGSERIGSHGVCKALQQKAGGIKQNERKICSCYLISKALEGLQVYTYTLYTVCVRPTWEAGAGPLFVCFPTIKITLPFVYFLILKNTKKIKKLHFLMANMDCIQVTELEKNAILQTII